MFQSVVMVSSSVTKCFQLWDLEPNSHQTGRYVCVDGVVVVVVVCSKHKRRWYMYMHVAKREEGGLSSADLQLKPRCIILHTDTQGDTQIKL